MQNVYDFFPATSLFFVVLHFYWCIDYGFRVQRQWLFFLVRFSVEKTVKNVRHKSECISFFRTFVEMAVNEDVTDGVVGRIFWLKPNSFVMLHGSWVLFFISKLRTELLVYCCSSISKLIMSSRDLLWQDIFMNCEGYKNSTRWVVIEWNKILCTPTTIHFTPSVCKCY